MTLSGREIMALLLVIWCAWLLGVYMGQKEPKP